MSAAEIKRKLEQNWAKFLTSNSEKLSSDRLDGASPPSIFVGRYGYPKVRIGPMVPPMHGDTTILDRPELWSGKTLEEIANFRLSLVRGVMESKVEDIESSYLQRLHEMALSTSSAESEVTFEKRPVVDIDAEMASGISTETTPFGPVAPLKTFQISSSLSTDSRMEKPYYDNDLSSTDAIFKLYRSGVEVSRIHQLLSLGMLGLRKNRKLVPTRWSISATDDSISSRLLIQIRNNSSIDLFELYQFAHLGNYYSVILMPDDVWKFEMFESWIGSNGKLYLESDFEIGKNLNRDPAIAGSYYSARLGIAEHLARRNRMASALVLREIHPEYVIPVGVWQIREGIRQCLKTDAKVFETFDASFNSAIADLSVSRSDILQKSYLYQFRKDQKRITDFV